jgi:hypothetical protein
MDEPYCQREEQSCARELLKHDAISTRNRRFFWGHWSLRPAKLKPATVEEFDTDERILPGTRRESQRIPNLRAPLPFWLQVLRLDLVSR